MTNTNNLQATTEKIRIIRHRQRRLYDIVETGHDGDFISIFYDVLSTGMIVLNLVISIMLTFDTIQARYATVLGTIELVTYLFFGLDYVLRILTASCKYTHTSDARAIRRYVFSFLGLVDLFSFLPYFLPVFFPEGAVAFRMIRVARIFRLFRITAYYDSLNVITEVLVSKKQQLLSSVFIILLLMLASSLCIYGLEHEAQPDVFQNAFSGIWWSVSTLLTVGYGDIYPITIGGRIFSIIIMFLGVGMVAIPTGIISAGFVDQYSRVKRISDFGLEEDIHFIKVSVQEDDAWCGKRIRDLALPDGLLIAAIQRRGGVTVPKGDVILEDDDILVLGARAFQDDTHIELKEVVIGEHNSWAGELISDIDISRKTIIVLVRRGEDVLVPKGNLRLLVGDIVYLYTQRRMKDALEIEV